MDFEDVCRERKDLQVLRWGTGEEVQSSYKVDVDDNKEVVVDMDTHEDRVLQEQQELLVQG